MQKTKQKYLLQGADLSNKYHYLRQPHVQNIGIFMEDKKSTPFS